MPDQTRTVAPGAEERSVRAEGGVILRVPAGWELLPPGDATLTRRVKAAGPTWTVQEKVGRRMFSRGVWADGESIARIRADLDRERADPAHAKKAEAQARRRERVQTAYVGTFRESVLSFLAFDPAHADLAERLADAVTAHATPIGSGTVARTERIPVEERAEAAVIAWMRHQTTAYDHLSIARRKGERRAVRRELAEQSRRVLARYRSATAAADPACPLRLALASG
ncbi:DUF2293 domain-containing protein [Tundrisphaera sp. TA3]|uniref:DUF2293 domain-containing protein n=1 Tax=Tundrisphaera sp. TA3 TaxID=3435775 RepID=UPI003EBA2431